MAQAIEFLKQQALEEVVLHPKKLITVFLVAVEDGPQGLLQRGLLDEGVHHVEDHLPPVPTHGDRGLVVGPGPRFQRGVEKTHHHQVPVFQDVRVVVVNPPFLEKPGLRRGFIHLFQVEGQRPHHLLLLGQPGRGVPRLPQGGAVFLEGPVNAPLKMAIGFLRAAQHQVQGAAPPQNGADDHQAAPGIQGRIDRGLHPVQDLLHDLRVTDVDVVLQVVQDHQIGPVLLVLQPPEPLAPAPGLHPDVV